MKKIIILCIMLIVSILSFGQGRINIKRKLQKAPGADNVIITNAQGKAEYHNLSDLFSGASGLNSNVLTLANGVAVDLTPYLDDTDNQTITDFSLNGTTLTLTLENGNTKTLDISSINTDNQALSLSGNIITLQNGGTVDLTPYLDNTDNQIITDFSLNAATDVLTITLEDGNTKTVDLSGISYWNKNAQNELEYTTDYDKSVSIKKYGNFGKVLSISRNGVANTETAFNVNGVNDFSISQNGKKSLTVKPGELTIQRDASSSEPISLKFKNIYGVDTTNSQIVYDYYGHNYGSGVLHGMIYQSGRAGLSKHWFIDDVGNVQLSISDNSHVRIGTGVTAPTEKLEVQGALQLGNNANSECIRVPSGTAIRQVTRSPNGVFYLDLGNVNIRDGDATTAKAGLKVGGSKFVVKNDNVGNVGIGTTTPTEKLDVVGKGKFSSTVSGADAINSTDFVTKQQLDASGDNLGNHIATQTMKLQGHNISFQDGVNSRFHIQSTGATLKIGGTGGASPALGAINIGNTDGGNVGIGKAPSSEKLEVNGNAVIGSTKIGSWVSGASWAYFGNKAIDNQGSKYALLQNEVGATYLNSASDLRLRILNTDKLILSPNLATFETPLEINRNEASNAISLADTYNRAGLRVKSSNNSGYLTIADGINNVMFLQSQSNTTTPKAISLNPFGGKVGIGTTTPTHDLTVQGNAKVTGNLKVGDILDLGGKIVDSQGQFGIDGQILKKINGNSVEWVSQKEYVSIAGWAIDITKTMTTSAPAAYGQSFIATSDHVGKKIKSVAFRVNSYAAATGVYFYVSVRKKDGTVNHFGQTMSSGVYVKKAIDYTLSEGDEVYIWTNLMGTDTTLDVTGFSATITVE